MPRRTVGADPEGRRDAPDAPDGALQRTEERLRTLHELRPDARLQAGVETAYVGFLRAQRERLHPRGVRHMRTLMLTDGLRQTESAQKAAGLSSANLLLVRPDGSRDRRVRAAVARQQRSGATSLVTSVADDDPRTVRLFTGLDPDLVSAALRDKTDAEGHALALSNEIRELRDEIARLRSERAALRAEVRRLGATSLGLAVGVARHLVRSACRSTLQVR